MNAIEVNKLTKYYGKNRGVIDIDLTVNKGEIFGFIGPNGAGKSTTIRTLLGFIRPTSGQAKIFDMDCVSQTCEVKQQVGYLPAEVNFYDAMKIYELLQYSGSFYKIENYKRMVELSALFDIDLGAKVDQLSLGNKKKVGIIQALMHDPKLLILDEPTNGLDPLMQNKFFDILREENERGTTIFFSSHNLNDIQRLCERVAIIKEGRILKVEQMDILRSNKFKKVKYELKSDDTISTNDLEGVSHQKIKERTIEFMYSGNIEKLLNALHDKEVENVWIEDPTLEEIFIHYYEKGGETQ